MGIQDRPYYRQQSYGRPGPYGGMMIGLPRPTPMVKKLLVINIAVFFAELFVGPRLTDFFAATGRPWYAALQVWRLITFQFLHAGVMHILFNMLGLYFLGPVLERNWGSRRFLTFYLVSGAVGGTLFTLASLAGVFHGDLIGASGGVLALLVACAVLYPQFRVILFIFPVPIRFAAVLFTLLYLYNVARGGPNAGGDLCHLGGMATGLVWVLGWPYLTRLRRRQRDIQWRNRQQGQAEYEREVDRILEKVHREGIHKLTRGERRILQRATEERKRRNSYGAGS